jgi:predicted N-acetyltransferase YhbS
MKILKAKPAEARKISLLRRKTLREINKNDYPPIFLKTLIENNSVKGVIKKMKKGNMFCAWEGDILIGTVEWEDNKVKGLYVKKSEIGKGIGAKLMDFIEDYIKSKGINKIRLYSTKYAFKFYKKRGYKLVKSGYWRMGKSKVRNRIMEKELK